QLLAFALGPELAEDLARRLRPQELVPARYGPYEFHEGEAAHETRPACREMAGKGRSPILDHEIGRAHAARGDEGVEIADMILEAIGDVGLAGLAEADEVRSDAMRDLRDQGDDVAP